MIECLKFFFFILMISPTLNVTSLYEIKTTELKIELLEVLNQTIVACQLSAQL